MVAIRQVNGISILDWESGVAIPPLAGEIKSLLEGGDVEAVLVNMAGCQSMKADDLEALTEALTVCRDRSCSIGMFGVHDRLARLVSVMGLSAELPPVLGADEASAVDSIKNGGATAASAPMSGEPQLEFEIDLDTQAPTARFDSTAMQASPSGADAQPCDTLEDQADRDLLAVYWGDLASQGYAIGGPEAERIMQAVAEAPTTPSLSPGAEEEGVIDLGDAMPIEQPTAETVEMPVFDLEEPTGWSAQPTGAEQVQFAPQDTGLTNEPTAVFGEAVTAESSPVDTTPPMKAPAPQPLVADSAAAPDGNETVMIQPGALEAALLQAGLSNEPAAARAPTSPGREDQNETVMFQPGALDMALLAEVAKAAGPPAPAAPPPVESVPPPAQPYAGLSEEEAEIRGFLHDYAISSNLHLQVLERFCKAKDQALGRSDLQLATGGGQGAVIEIVDQFVQSRLVRRTRSMRVRGGSGFTLAVSPRTQSSMIRLLRLLTDPSSRAKVGSWLQG